MASLLDNRLQQRSMSKGQLPRGQAAGARQELPDSAENVCRPDEEELERVREELEKERATREARIECALTEPREVEQAPQAPVIPFEP